MNAHDLPSPVLVAVVTRAGRRCECTGSCGRDHARNHGDGRCDAGAGLSQVLYAAPRDPGVPAHAAWRVPDAELAAWCPGCLDRARRLAAAPRRRRPACDGQALPLFEIDQRPEVA